MKFKHHRRLAVKVKVTVCMSSQSNNTIRHNFIYQTDRKFYNRNQPITSVYREFGSTQDITKRIALAVIDQEHDMVFITNTKLTVYDNGNYAITWQESKIRYIREYKEIMKLNEIVYNICLPLSRKQADELFLD